MEDYLEYLPIHLNLQYGGTYRLKQNFTLHVVTTFGIDAAHMQSN